MQPSSNVKLLSFRGYFGSLVQNCLLNRFFHCPLWKVGHARFNEGFTEYLVSPRLRKFRYLWVSGAGPFWGPVEGSLIDYFFLPNTVSYSYS